MDHNYYTRQDMDGLRSATNDSHPSTSPPHPSRPAITTNFDNVNSNALRVPYIGDSAGGKLDGQSPNIEDFYKFQDPFVVSQTNGDTMPTASQARRNTPSTFHNTPLNGNPSSPRPSYRVSSAPSNPTSPLTTASSNPSFGTARAQQSSLKDIVNRFEQKSVSSAAPPKLRPPYTSNPRSTSPGKKSGLPEVRPRKPPGWKPAHGGTNGAASEGPTKLQKSPARKNAHERTSPNGSTKSAYQRSQSESAQPDSKNGNLPSLQLPGAPNGIPPRRTLFGEVLSVNTNSNDPGYLIPGRPRGASDSDLQDPSFDAVETPLSATDFYRGVMSSPENVAGLGHRHTESGSTIGYESNRDSIETHRLKVQSPPRGSRSREASPSSPRTPSRIPVTSRARSNTDESGPSPPSTRASSAASGRFPTKGRTALPTPQKRNRSPKHLKVNQHPALLSSSHGSKRDYSPNRTGGTSPRLNAYIKAPMAKESPPLRSSRPRLPISEKSSPKRPAYGHYDPERSRDRPSRLQKPRKEKEIDPVLQDVDFAARRQKVRNAFSKELDDFRKTQLLEAEQEKLANEKVLEEQRITLHGEENLPEDASGPVIDPAEKPPAVALLSNATYIAPTQNLPAVSSTDKGLEEEVQKRLRVDTADISKSFRVGEYSDYSDLEKSQTLGVSQGQHEITTDEIASAVSASTPIEDSIETPIDDEPQTELGTDVRPESLVVPPSSANTLLSHVMRLREPSPAGTERFDSTSDTGSIQIILEGTPESSSRSFSEQDDDYYNHNSQRSSMNSESFIYERDEFASKRESILESISESPSRYQIPGDFPASPEQNQNGGTPQHQEIAAWASPTEIENLEKPTSTTEPSLATQPSSDPNASKSEDIRRKQQQLLQGSDLARRAGWDTRRATELFMTETRHEWTKPQDATMSYHSQVAEHGHVDNEACLDSPSNFYSDVDNSPSELLRDVEYEDWLAKQEQERMEKLSTSPTITHLSSMTFDRASSGAKGPTPPPKDVNVRASIAPPLPDKVPLGADPIKHEVLSGTTTWPGSKLHDSPPRLPVLESGPELGLAIQLSDNPVSPDVSAPTVQPPQPPYTPPEPPRISLESAEDFYKSHSQQFEVPPRHTSVAFTEKTETTARPVSVQIHRTRDSIASRLSASGVSVSNSEGPEPVRFSEDSIAQESIKSAGSGTRTTKQFFKRWNTIKEMIDTEKTYCGDLKVWVEIYKGTSSSCPTLTAEDIKGLFGNSRAVVEFSEVFGEVLKKAVKSVYIPNVKKGGKDVLIAVPDDLEAVEDQDRKTTLGAVFCEYLPRMEKIYGEYLRNHDAANEILVKIKNDSAVNLWVQECVSMSQDLTKAWDLDSMVTKPSQRMLKYPLMLKDILSTTPHDHPDYEKIKQATAAIPASLDRINESKRHMEVVEKVISSRKRKESNVGIGISKAFRKMPRGSAAAEKDADYDKRVDRFNTDYLHVQLIVRDFAQYLNEVQKYSERFNLMLGAMEGAIMPGESNHHAVESKWLKFVLAMRDMGAVALTDHKNAIRTRAYEPLTTLLRMYEKPQYLMKKRDKRSLDHARYKALIEGGEKDSKIDKRLKEYNETYVSLNTMLKDQFPKLRSNTKKLVLACQNAFVQIQMEWNVVWQAKMKSLMEDPNVSVELTDIVQQWKDDYEVVSKPVESLAITTKMSPSLEKTPNPSLLSPQSTRDSTSSKRPSVLETRPRGQSVNSHSPSLPTPDFEKNFERRQSGGFLGSPAIMSPMDMRPSGVPSPVYSRENTPAQSTWDQYLHSRNNSNTPASSTFTAQPRPSTSTTQSRPHSSSTFDTPSSSSRPFSGTFSSAMPMDDSLDNTITSSMQSQEPRYVEPPTQYRSVKVLFAAASLFEFNIDRARTEAGYPYLTYVAGEIFDVVGEKGELWLAKNQDDKTDAVGWLWCKHFIKLD
jgi:dynamin-binding protein